MEARQCACHLVTPPRLRRSNRIVRLLGAAALITALSAPGFAASARTRNFIVSAPNQALATEIAQAAELFRRDLAIEWLGRPLPDWPDPCPIVADVSSSLGAGGRTSFMFRQRRPFGWEMEVQGSRERVLDSVLPHEVTHTIFATHFGRPLPRWADEGACTTVEHQSERRKQELWLVQFLKTERGIPFNQMFAMTEYPGDILPLYSQGYSVARYLIAQGGKPKFVDFVGAGMDTGDWNGAIRSFYGFRSLGDLQLTWVDWVVDGSNESVAGPNPNNGVQLASAQAPAQSPPPPVGTLASNSPVGVGRQAVPEGGRSWYARRESRGPLQAAPEQPSAPRVENGIVGNGIAPERSATTLDHTGWRSLSRRQEAAGTRMMSELPSRTQRY